MNPQAEIQAGIQLVYADASLLVLDKPSGLLSVPGKGEDKQDCLSTRVQTVYADALVVHRLDMATSGLMMMARGSQAQRRLSDAFANRAVSKQYCALVTGRLNPAKDGWGVIDLPIALEWPRRPLRHIDAATGKPSLTRWRLDSQASPVSAIDFEHSAAFTRLVLAPETGRSHQLRVHLAAIGHPILGDTLYAPIEVQQRAGRLLLHASDLALTHPETGQIMQFHSPPPF